MGPCHSCHLWEHQLRCYLDWLHLFFSLTHWAWLESSQCKLGSQLPPQTCSGPSTSAGSQYSYCTSGWLCGEIRDGTKWAVFPLLSPFMWLRESPKGRGSTWQYYFVVLYNLPCRWTCCFSVSILRLVRTTQVMDSPSSSSRLGSWGKEKVKLPSVLFLRFK